MDGPLKNTLIMRIGVPTAIIVGMWLISRRRQLTREQVGLRWPHGFFWLLVLSAWAVEIFVEDLIAERFGVGVPSDWSGRGPLLLALLGVGMVLLAPFTEELVFRGVVFHQLKARWGVAMTIGLTAAFFGLLHLQYGALEVGLICFHGVVYGLALQRSAETTHPCSSEVDHTRNNARRCVLSVRGARMKHEAPDS
ncbi:MAG: CPBP family intramembrane metalloprotease, partial [Myxococcaceae bacterium]|nr:CPBP family intramembrane metalloprotease [Myxococcaceae bacterium]